MKRVEFLKSLGFGGASLMALLASCQQQQLLPDGEVASGIPGSSTPSSTSTTTPVSATTTSPGATTVTAPVNATTSPTITALLTLNLTDTANAALLKNGGYITKSGIVIARTSQGLYVAATQTCSHEPRKNVIFQSDSYGCTVHGARFSLAGKGLNSLGSGGLKIYTVTLSGTILSIS